MKKRDLEVLSSSFRDPNGFVFTLDGELYRQINLKYQSNYEKLISSGLYDLLTRKKLLIGHEEVSLSLEDNRAYKIIKPETIGFISYPYEWSFSQLQDAALLTLRVQRLALKHGMILKDASAYNIQFYKGKPVFIDTLSFEVYREGEPWTAYRQFCQHFLAPIALMAHINVEFGKLSRLYIDGLPLPFVSNLLPGRTYFNIGLLIHIHLHTKAQMRYSDKKVAITRSRVTKTTLLALTEHLERTVKSLRWRPEGTEWAEYYDFTNYTDAAFESKKSIILGWLEKTSPQTVWDLGANNGEFTRLASERGIQAVAFDIDPSAVEKNYRQIKRKKELSLLPLVMDLANPSPAIGWHNQERYSLPERGPANMVFALALIHHLTITYNIPLERQASYFSDLCEYLVIEFVPKTDSQVQKLLMNREDIFEGYTLDNFEVIFEQIFDILERRQVEESDRFLYLMRRKLS